jgi:hypothetical protein
MAWTAGRIPHCVVTPVAGGKEGKNRASKVRRGLSWTRRLTLHSGMLAGISREWEAPICDNISTNHYI